MPAPVDNAGNDIFANPSRTTRLLRTITGLPALAVGLGEMWSYPDIRNSANDKPFKERPFVSYLETYAEKGAVARTEMLLWLGHNPNLAGYFGQTPLDEAVRLDNLKLARVLGRYGAKVPLAYKSITDGTVADLGILRVQKQHVSECESVLPRPIPSDAMRETLIAIGRRNGWLPDNRQRLAM